MRCRAQVAASDGGACVWTVEFGSAPCGDRILLLRHNSGEPVLSVASREYLQAVEARRPRESKEYGAGCPSGLPPGFLQSPSRHHRHSLAGYDTRTWTDRRDTQEPLELGGDAPTATAKRSNSHGQEHLTTNATLT